MNRDELRSLLRDVSEGWSGADDIIEAYDTLQADLAKLRAVVEAAKAFDSECSGSGCGSTCYKHQDARDAAAPAEGREE